MKVLKNIKEVREEVRKIKEDGETIGFVPTMGYLHEGHLSLVRYAKKENQKVFMSIFVNPAQFSPQEDLSTYPRDIQRDEDLALKEGVDVIFAPEVQEIYPEGFCTYVDVENLTDNLCGASREGHFRGVATVVAKLFNIVTPDKVYFGQKDAQQAAVIGKLIKDLNFPLDMVVCPIVREEDGLAMSSRNVYLSKEERAQALVLNRSLRMAEEIFFEGERNAENILRAVRENIQKMDLVRIDYVKLVDRETMEDLKEISESALLAVAAFVGRTRLIDNVILEVKNV